MILAYYQSPLGRITLASDGKTLTGLWFDGQKHFGSTLNSKEESRVAKEESADAANNASFSVFHSSFFWLDIYFSGREPDFTPPISPHGTPFQQRVWEELIAIPYGSTTSYGELARRLHVHSAQAVGGAVGRNPISIIIPCHRVVGTNGSLTGYAAGLDRKRTLLQLEQKGVSEKRRTIY